MAKITDKIQLLPPEAQHFSLEFFPPKTSAGFQNLIPRLHRLRTLQPLFVCVTFSAGGATASKSLELADICQNQLSLTTCLHLTCTNLKRATIDHVLEECKKLGIRNILALRGDEPRDGEYAAVEQTNGRHDDKIKNEDVEDDSTRFTHAVDLISYIRRKHGDHFCIGAAAYPEGHPTPSPSHSGGYYQSPEQDVPHLIEKVKAGADFFLTQLFYDADKYLSFERMLRTHDSGLFEALPIIPGLMPVQGWQSFSRTCKLARVGLPEDIREKLHTLKGDDEGVKRTGVEILSNIVDRIKKERWSAGQETSSAQDGARKRRLPQGYHFYTLNLEKAVAQILERCQLLVLPQDDSDVTTRNGIGDSENCAVVIDESGTSPPVAGSAIRRRHRTSSVHNRVVVSAVSSPTSEKNEYEALESEAGVPRDEAKDEKDALAIAEGEGSLGREATWDDFPNGRWGDSRSPAYASTNIYTLHPQLAPSSALSLWQHPTSPSDISAIFRKYLTGQIAASPWSEEGLSPETEAIKDQLVSLNERGWWTVASQPAVNACQSGDDVFGWGPRTGGWVWQKPFVEFFLPSKDWNILRERLDKLAANDEVTFYAGNAAGEFQVSDESSVNPVTWGAFKGKEIITPTIIEPTSFLAWRDEAFAIWREWGRVFPASSPSAKLLKGLSEDCWLVNVVGHDYVDGQSLWRSLLE